MDKYIFFQTKHQVGFCDIKNRNQYAYEYDLQPIEFSILEATDEYIDSLLDVLQQDHNAFVDWIKSEMQADLYRVFTS